MPRRRAVKSKSKGKVVRKKVPKRPLTAAQKRQQKLYEKFLKSKPGEKFLLAPRKVSTRRKKKKKQ